MRKHKHITRHIMLHTVAIGLPDTPDNHCSRSAPAHDQ